MSPSERRRQLWKKSTRNEFKKLQKWVNKNYTNGDYLRNRVIVGLTEGIEMPYVQVVIGTNRSPKLYMPKGLNNSTRHAMVGALVKDTRKLRSKP